MKRPEFAQIVADMNAQFQGRTVVLTDDDPTGVGFYGETGMKADVIRISESEEDDMEFFEVALDFGVHRAHNINFEKADWNGKNNTLVTATEGGYVQDKVTIGLDAKDLAGYMKLADPNPVYDAWRLTGDGVPYVAWLEAIAMTALDLQPVEPEEAETPSV